MNRAQRRRLERDGGKHRAAGKKGRRAPIRLPVIEDSQSRYESLERAGFVIAAPNIEDPQRGRQ